MSVFQHRSFRWFFRNLPSSARFTFSPGNASYTFGQRQFRINAKFYSLSKYPFFSFEKSEPYIVPFIMLIPILVQFYFFIFFTSHNTGVGHLTKKWPMATRSTVICYLKHPHAVLNILWNAISCLEKDCTNTTMYRFLLYVE